MKPANSSFYLARAAESARQAQEATLDNVRERNLRSEASWRTMAEQASAIEKEREQRDAEKAERDEQRQLAQADSSTPNG